ncbi:hypothetical protein QE152_g19136 [Popillia japonica]|uniref:Uncharacterized protein n=1 Tax=Popillia japonica TaxID=7064 RepID=A0AAW1L2J3_POPJA
MPRGQGQWQTPVAYMRNMEAMFTKLEKTDILKPLDLENEISYFKNERAKGHTAAFDLFFAYTKTFPLFDHRKCRDDRKYLPDVWANIYEQCGNRKNYRGDRMRKEGIIFLSVKLRKDKPTTDVETARKYGH